MYKIKQTKNGYDIQLTRGDSFMTAVELTKNEEPYTPTDDDTVRFALKHNKFKQDRSDYQDDEPLLLITIPNDTMILTINPNDTKPFAFGEYAYDIELTYNGIVDTFISGTLTLTPEVD